MSNSGSQLPLNKDKAESKEVEQELYQRIEVLESRVTFQEDALEALDRVIADQDRQLGRQQMQLQLLAEKFKALETRVDHSPVSPGDERPPHY